MKKVTFSSVLILVLGIMMISSCSTQRDLTRNANDMYYKPTEARKQALAEERRLSRERAEMAERGLLDDTPGAISSSESLQRRAFDDEEFYDEGYRMSYNGYFNRFGSFRPAPRMSFGMGLGLGMGMGMMGSRFMSPGMSFWMGYNSFGGGMGMMHPMGMGMMGYNPMFGMYDPFFSPWGGGMMMGYNPYMMGFHNPFMGMGMMGYNHGFMQGYMMGSMNRHPAMMGGGFHSSRPQPMVMRRSTMGSNQVGRSTRNTRDSRAVSSGSRYNNTNSRGSSVRGSSSPAQRRTEARTPARSSNRSYNTRRSTTPSRSYTPSRSTTPSRSYTPSRSSTPSRSYTPSRSSTPSRSYTPSRSSTPSRSYSAPRSAPSRSSSPARSSGGGSRGGRR